uniref:ATP synthase complex subunit 8 n=1 Tax=Pteroptyx tener TaxID=2035279 RepID=A0A8A4HPI3_9COLE|nr:ATP synthase F0 subunit 8 [Pteroptyx tener]QTC08244.1 ATP synthase F0 subunit 8 [Pteroptyx tener]QTC08257.1 ATP synthase F0 subunit 8 [Pteroptyx tener]QTC08270.1 ATP synthase F0 subunit 8 [Pteroptyx tener]QTC08283.1 ATP synthase F0 subunit 8 [Pteroptyx tener]UYE92347.1 ATP synthase F0 subunit 8 [Pteroptyx tener]
MPQMAPLSWLNLFIFFIMIFMLFNVMNYFSLIYKNNNIKKDTKKSIITWKW